MPAADNVVRLLPPLNITDEEIAEAVEPPRSLPRIALTSLKCLVRKLAHAKATTMTHFLDIHYDPSDALRDIIDNAKAMKDARAGLPKGAPDEDQPLAGPMVALIFEKPSTRTRVSFDVGVRQMGGQTMVLSGADMQLGHGETIADTARVLSPLCRSDHDPHL